MEVAEPESPKTYTKAEKCEGVLVMGADYRGLAVIRSLGRHGVPVWVMKQSGQLIGAFSRYAARTIQCDAVNDAERLNILVGLSSKHLLSNWILFPTDDESVGLVARHYDQLAGCYRLATPNWEMLQWACNKKLLSEIAQEAGVDYPWTFCPSGREEVEAFDGDFPVILKPALREAFNRFTADKAWFVGSKAELIARYDEACSFLPKDLVMVQELIPGGGEAQYSFAALCQEGKPLASICARRTRQYPMDFGRASTYVESIEHPQIASAAERLLQRLEITGLVEVEFKYDFRDGRFKLLDVNPRVWGWHSLGRRAGVDFPLLLWQMLNGDRISRRVGRPGIAWIRSSTDLVVAAKEIFKGNLSVSAYLRSLGSPLEHAIFAADDPWPAVLEFPLLGYLLVKRLLRHKPI